MEYTLQPSERVSAGIKRIVDGKIERGIEHIDGDMPRHETVHEVRKRCKEVRAAVRLVRPVLPTYSEENAQYRDAARRVSDIRDAHAAIETFDDHIDELASEDGTLDSEQREEIRATLVERRDRIANEQGVDERLEQVRQDLVEGRTRVDDLPIATEGYDAVAGGLRKSYKRARNRMNDAYEDPEFEQFHEWRKRIKYHRYHTRLLRRVWVGPMKARRAELKTLSDVIGDENDLAEFRMTMESENLFEESTRERLTERIRGQRAALQRKGRVLGERLFTEPPDTLVERIRGYWDGTREFEPES